MNISARVIDQLSTVLTEVDDQLNNYTGSLLQRIADDYNLSFDDLKERYMGDIDFVPVQVKVSGDKREKKAMREVPSDKRCVGLTGKGQPCKFQACDGSNMCKIHIKKTGGVVPEVTPVQEPVEPKKRGRKPKAKKEVPVHNHEIGEKPEEICGLCESHGDASKPELPSRDFVDIPSMDGMSLNDKLKALLEAHDQMEEDENGDDTNRDAELEELANEEELDELANALGNMEVDNDEDKMTAEEYEEFKEQAETPPSKAKLDKLKGKFELNNVKGLVVEDLDDEI